MTEVLLAERKVQKFRRMTFPVVTKPVERHRDIYNITPRDTGHTHCTSPLLAPLAVPHKGKSEGSVANNRPHYLIPLRPVIHLPDMAGIFIACHNAKTVSSRFWMNHQPHHK